MLDCLRDYGIEPTRIEAFLLATDRKRSGATVSHWHEHFPEFADQGRASGAEKPKRDHRIEGSR